MRSNDLNPTLLRAWLEARSIVRDLPVPVEDRGGFRVDTLSATEIARWIFPEVKPGLIELGRTISDPGYFIKLCGCVDELCAFLPERWKPLPLGYFMRADGAPPQSRLPEGYLVEIESNGPRTSARIIDTDGQTAASGYAAQTERVFIYDRIATDARHRRKGLGRSLMRIRSVKTNDSLPELLVATEDGRKLYEALGWRTLSAYATATIPADVP